MTIIIKNGWKAIRNHPKKTTWLHIFNVVILDTCLSSAPIISSTECQQKQQQQQQPMLSIQKFRIFLNPDYQPPRNIPVFVLFKGDSDVTDEERASLVKYKVPELAAYCFPTSLGTPHFVTFCHFVGEHYMGDFSLISD